jgi:hypothetical protein
LIRKKAKIRKSAASAALFSFGKYNNKKEGTINMHDHHAYGAFTVSSGYEKDGFEDLTDGFEPSKNKVMIAPIGANDVFAVSGKSDVVPVGRSDVMCSAYHARSAHRLAKPNITPDGASRSA